jgi:hypothetical protein
MIVRVAAAETSGLASSARHTVEQASRVTVSSATVRIFHIRTFPFRCSAPKFNVLETEFIRCATRDFLDTSSESRTLAVCRSSGHVFPQRGLPTGVRREARALAPPSLTLGGAPEWHRDRSENARRNLHAVAALITHG